MVHNQSSIPAQSSSTLPYSIPGFFGQMVETTSVEKKKYS